MQANELKTLLQDSAYIIKQHIGYCDANTKALPLRTYSNIVKALNEMQDTDSTKKEDAIVLLDLNNVKNKEIELTAPSLLIEHKLLSDAQVRHYKNRPLIDKCNEYALEYGIDAFNIILNRIEAYRNKGVKIGNMQAYINRAIDNAIKDASSKIE